MIKTFKVCSTTLIKESIYLPPKQFSLVKDMPICPTFIPRVTVLEEIIILEFVGQKKKPFILKGLLAIILQFLQI
jgi:hypothetical protein